MSSSSTGTSQKKKIRQFVQFANSSERDAIKFLKQNSWNLERSMDAYFVSQAASGKGMGTPVNSNDQLMSSLNRLFDSYCDSDKLDKITLDGTARLCQDLQVDPADPVMLAVAYILKAPKMCVFERQGWIDGWLEAGCSNLSDIIALIPKLRKRLQEDSEFFREVYIFTFKYSLEDHQKSLPIEVALQLWEILLSGKFDLIQNWLGFLRDYKKAISKDTWNLFLEFCTSPESSIENYDAEGAWPVLIDEFVEHMKQDKM